MANELIQPKGSVSKETNIQSIARITGSKIEEVKYLEDNLDVTGLKYLYDSSTETTWILSGVEMGTIDSWIIQDDTMQLLTSEGTYSLNLYDINNYATLKELHSQYTNTATLNGVTGASLIGTSRNTTVEDELNKLYNHENSVVYAIDYGVSPDSSIDCSDALQQLIDTSGSKLIILPKGIGLSKPVKYRSRTTICGVENSYTIVNILKNFVGNSAFEPISKDQTGTDSAVLSNLTITDLSAANDGRGSTSTKNGVDITGSFNLRLNNINGVRLNNTIYSEPGTALQHTRRTRIDSLNGSNVNRHIYMQGSGDARFAYGDIYINDMKTSASCNYPNIIETTDGLQFIGGVIFPGGGFRVSGNYLNFEGVHFFEPKAPLGSGEIPAGLYITRRNNTLYSEYVNINGCAMAFCGRLANTTSGNPPQVNEPAPGLLMDRVRNFNISVTVNHCSMQSAHLIECTTGILNLSSTEANTQLLGSGALPPGTYDTLLMERCGNVNVEISDTSASRRYAVNMDDDCSGCKVSGVVSRGYTLGTNIKYPTTNNYNLIDLMVEDSASSRYHLNTNPPTSVYVTSNNGSTSPSVTGGRNNVVVEFSNSVVTNVTDLPDVTNRREVTVWLNDNNATRIIDVSNGGKFKLLAGANIMGRGTYLRFIRDAASGNLLQIAGSVLNNSKFYYTTPEEYGGSIQNAIDSLPNGGIVQLANKTYNGDITLKSGISLIGANMPTYDTVANKWSSGTLINGQIFCSNANGFKVSNLGIDVYASGKNAISGVTPATGNGVVEFVSTRANNHGQLWEANDNNPSNSNSIGHILISDCKHYGGPNGFVSKHNAITFLRCEAYYVTIQGFVVVSDNINNSTTYSRATNTIIQDCWHINDNTLNPNNEGIRVYSRDYNMTTPTVLGVSKLQIRNFNCIGASAIVRTGENADAPPSFNKVANQDIIISDMSYNPSRYACYQIDSTVRLNFDNCTWGNQTNIDMKNNSSSFIYVSKNNIAIAGATLGGAETGVYNISDNSTSILARAGQTVIKVNNTASTVINSIGFGTAGREHYIMLMEDFTTISLNGVSYKGKGKVLHIRHNGVAWDVFSFV